MVQCSGTVEEEGWDAALLHGLLQAQHMNQERLLSTAAGTGGIGEYSRHCPFLSDGFQDWVLAGEDGAGVLPLQ